MLGPCNYSSECTHGGADNNKKLGVIFTSLSMHAVHIELIKAMDTSSFINTLCWFLILGPMKLISYNWHEFQGSLQKAENTPTRWPTSPGSSMKRTVHGSSIYPYTGVWDRMIGVSRRIPDSMLSQIQPSHLTHKVLSTLMEEVSNIINAGPLTTISMHANASPLLTPNMIIIHKVCSPRPPPRCFIDADLHRQQLRRVQHFWERWRPEHLFTLQRCSKWQKSQPNIKEGDIVLFHDTQVKRNQWPMAVVMKSFPTSDSKVRTLKLIVTRGLHGLLLNLQVFNSVFNTDICV